MAIRNDIYGDGYGTFSGKKIGHGAARGTTMKGKKGKRSMALKELNRKREQAKVQVQSKEGMTITRRIADPKAPRYVFW